MKVTIVRIFLVSFGYLLLIGCGKPATRISEMASPLPTPVFEPADLTLEPSPTPSPTPATPAAPAKAPVTPAAPVKDNGDAFSLGGF